MLKLPLKQITKSLAYIVFMLVCVLWELSIVQVLPPWLAPRPILPFLVLMASVMRLRDALGVAVVAGWFLDIYRFTPWPIAILFYSTLVGIVRSTTRYVSVRTIYAMWAFVVCARGLERLFVVLTGSEDVAWAIEQVGWIRTMLPVFLWDVACVTLGYWVKVLHKRQKGTS